MPAIIQVQVDEETEAAANSLYESLGFDTPTAIRMFLSASLRVNGMPFPLKRRFNAETLEAMEDTRLGRNLYGPYKTVQEALEALESEDA